MFNESSLEHYIARHKDIASSEKNKSVKILFQITDCINPAWSAATQSIYTYMRTIDDYVDETPYALPAGRVIEAEREGLSGTTAPTPLQHELIEKPLRDLFGPKEVRVKGYLDKILDGVGMDLKLRLTQTPLTESQLRGRNFRVTYYPFAVFFMGTAGVDPKPTLPVVEAFHNFASYDNVSDIFEDLPVGLNLIPAHDMRRFGLSFQDGQTLDIEHLRHYNRVRRSELRPRIRQSGVAFHGLGLPTWLAVLLHTYFYTRTFKMLKGLPEAGELVYRTPLDAQSFFLQKVGTLAN